MDLRKMALAMSAASIAMFLGTAWAQEGEEQKEPDPAQQRVEFMTQRLQESLGLSEEQVGKVKEILTETYAARTAAEEETAKAIEEHLTPEQVETYRKHREEMAARRANWGRGPREEGQEPRGEPREGRGEGRMRRPRTAEDQVAQLKELLGLSEEQATAIKEIVEKAFAARKEASDKEAERIRAILTEEQAARYDEMRAMREGRGGDRPGRGGDYY